MVLRIYARVLSEIESHRSATSPAVPCGLLIGRELNGVIWATRSLRCSNAAREGDRLDAFEIDPRVLVNVGRSLAASPDTVLGFYYVGSANTARPTPHDAELLRRSTGSLLLIRGSGAGVEADVRAWIDDGPVDPPRELRLEVVEPRASSLFACPE